MWNLLKGVKKLHTHKRWTHKYNVYERFARTLQTLCAAYYLFMKIKILTQDSNRRNKERRGKPISTSVNALKMHQILWVASLQRYANVCAVHCELCAKFGDHFMLIFLFIFRCSLKLLNFPGSVSVYTKYSTHSHYFHILLQTKKNSTRTENVSCLFICDV